MSENITIKDLTKMLIDTFGLLKKHPTHAQVRDALWKLFGEEPDDETVDDVLEEASK